MGVLDSLIVFSCIGMTGQQNDACNKALVAGSKQSGIEQASDTYENHQLRLLEKDAYEWLGKDAVSVVGGTAWVTKSLVERKASFGLPTLGLCDSLATEINQNVAQLVFKWKF